jgi:hypothetical protein
MMPDALSAVALLLAVVDQALVGIVHLNKKGPRDASL